jgi:hypothetical protein
MDYLIEQMFTALPCTSLAEIAEKLSRLTRSKVSAGNVGVLLTHLRKHRDEYQWTVPHAKRGPNADGGDRFHAVLVSDDGSLELNKETLQPIEDGMRGTVSHAATSLDNEVAALTAYAPHITSRNKRAALREVIDDMSYTARKCMKLLEAIDESRNGTTG